MLSAPAAVYRPRNPQSSDYYRCVEDHFETFVQIYEERFERPFGFWRPYLAFIEDREVINAILKHLALWLVQLPPAPKAHAPPARNQYGSGQAGYVLDHFCQLSMNDDHLHRDPDYPWDAYLQS